MAGTSAERQENAVINAINAHAKIDSPITILTGSTKINNVIKAEKYTGRQVGGSEPYTDVQLFLKNKTTINISLKGESAPSLAGGGLSGLEQIVPGIAKTFMKAAFNYCLKIKLNAGDKVPDVYGKINASHKLKIIKGNVAIGGPIDYMYIGSMDPASRYDPKGKILTFTNGKFIPVDVYSRTHELYFRLRARREDQRFDPNAKDGSGTPKIYGKSPSKGDSAGRIVVTDKVPNSANIIDVK
jgi:hypothetical protein